MFYQNSAPVSTETDSSNSQDMSNYHPSEYPGILDTELVSLTLEQRIAFTITVSLLCILSLCGNFSTLHVNLRRKMRPFFRACLISLALSDLLSTVFLSAAYLGQFTTNYVQVWSLGVVMCSLDPFATTAAILASSMTLVGIAVFRYHAVMTTVVGAWNPGVTFSVTCILGVWAISFAIASPVFLIYHTISVYILSQEDVSSLTDFKEENEDVDTDFSYIIVKQKGLVTMCVSDQQDVALYYVIVFSIIFVPCIVSFVWLNSIIAKRIWKRRHHAGVHKRQSKSLKSAPTLSVELEHVDGSTTANITMTVGAGSSEMSTTARQIPKINFNNSNARETRHIRMFVVVTLLVAVFIFLRLPAWIFLVMRLYGSYTKQHDWIIYFVFGILNLASCALNPLFYTFLPETIRYISCCKLTFFPGGCCDRKCCRTQKKCAEKETATDEVCVVCYGVLCGRFWLCQPTSSHMRKNRHPQEVTINLESGLKRIPLSFEKDEGVVVDVDVDEYDNEDEVLNDSNDVELTFNHHIFTVYSATLVSASTTTSENL